MSSRTAEARPSARTFLLQAGGWALALFAVLRLEWVDRHVVTALVGFERVLALWYGAGTPGPIVVTSSCSGTDVMALCAAVTLAYPVAWTRRAAGAALGMAIVLVANVARIASLYAVASNPRALELLHLYVWPLVLCGVAFTFVSVWMRVVDGRALEAGSPWRRFGLLLAAALVVYAAAVPWVFTSVTMERAGAWTASSAGTVLGALGATVEVNGAVLATSRGAFQITPECLFTPMLPLFLAAVLAFARSREHRVAGVLAALPLFFALGVARVLVLALPRLVVDSPIVLVHGFYQLLGGVAAIAVAAHVSSERRLPARASSHAAVALGVALLAGVAAAWTWKPVLAPLAGLLRLVVPPAMPSFDVPGDAQGAFALLPAFQVGLLAGLWWALTGPRRPGAAALALGAIGVSQIGLLGIVGIATTWSGAAPHALLVRAWALAVPIAVALLFSPSAATVAGDGGYRHFWEEVGDEFPSLTGAASTSLYFENEKRLLAEALPSLEGCRLLKTDLWDEAKNTRILQWTAERGACVHGIDLSEPIVRQARAAFGERPLRCVVSDVRRLPFADGSFGAIYSMGTVEHFAETEAAVVELARVLEPGGRLILGVPNRHDPFLRPVMVAALYALGLYGYGYEKSYSRRALRRMLENAGLEVTLESGILFVPGWLRMLDLWVYTRARPAASLTGLLIRPFAWLDARVPALRRHGYLIASVGVKPR